MSNLTVNSSSLQLEQILLIDAGASIVMALTPGNAHELMPVAGEHYRLIRYLGDDSQLLDQVIATRLKDDLSIMAADGTQLLIKNYYDLCAAEETTVEQATCSITLAGDGAAGYMLSPVSSLSASPSNPVIVYAHGDPSQLSLLVLNDEAAAQALTDFLSPPALSTASPVATPLLLTGLLGGAISSNSTSASTPTASASETALAKIADYADSNSNTAPTLQDYTDAGVTGVNSASLALVNTAIDAVTKTQADTKTEVQVLVSEAIALAKIADYADSNSNTAPTLQDYTDAGVTGVNAASLALVNSAIDDATKTQADTKSEIQALVTQANALVPLSKVAAGIGGFAINGIASGDNSGYSVSSAGDVNADGYADVIIGAPYVDTNASNGGASYLVFGKATSTTVNLSDITTGTGGFVINGISASDYSGYSVSSAGDVNGDGYDDFTIGAYGVSSSTGASYVVFGKSTTTAVELSTVATGSGGFVINGIDTGDQSGYSVSSAGDVNGDGLDDLIIGARYDDTNATKAGASYVVFGKTTGTAVDLSNIVAGTGGFTINGANVRDYSGYSVSGAGDVNGDGLADLIVGAYANDANASLAGSSYVVFGKSATTAVEVSNLGAGGFAIKGISASDYSGRSVSSAGDVNGDGYDDLLIGADGVDTNGSKSGASYVVFGKSGTTDVELSSITSGTGGFVINGVSTDDNSGYSVSAAGDVNGDGLDDIIVGANYDDPNGGQSGASFVVFGKATTTTVELSDIELGTGGFVINGINANDTSGFSVSGAGDVNGDGFADLLIGAPNADINAVDSGSSYVVFGGLGSSATVGTSSADTLTGDTGVNQLIGGAGNDVLLGKGGADVLSGGSGDDVLAIVDANFAKIAGGLGTDTLRFDANFNLNMTNLANNKVDSIEAIDLNNQGSTLTLNVGDILSIAGSGAANDLRIFGGATDSVDRSGTNFTDSGTDVTVSSVTYDVYTDSNLDASVRLLIEQELTVL